MVRAILVCLVCAVLMPNALHAAENRIVVEPIANSTGDTRLEPLSAGFSDLLVACLSGYDGLEILYREDLQRIWEELAQSRAGFDSSDTLELGALIEANVLIRGGFVYVGGALQANIHVYDIATTQLRFSLEERSDIEGVDELAAAMAQRIADTLTNGGGSVQSARTDAAPLISTHFIKGLGYHYNGLYDHAVAEFMQVIDLDPSHADARLWLGKSYAAGGESDHAALEYRRFLREFPDHEEAEHARAALAGE